MTALHTLTKLDYNLVLQWFKNTDHASEARDAGSKYPEMLQNFHSIYESPDLASRPDEKAPDIASNILIKKYQVDWERLFRKDKKSLPPVPETYLVKILVSSVKDIPLSEVSNKYIVPYHDTKYLKRASAEAFGILESNIIGSKNSSEYPDMYKEETEEEMGRDVEMLIRCIGKDDPKTIEDLFDLLQDRAEEAFAQKDNQTYRSCNSLLVSFFYLEWNDEQMTEFDRFFNDPINTQIMDDWVNYKVKHGRELTKLFFPTGFPNGLFRQHVEGFIGYYDTNRFELNTFIVSTLISSFEDGKQILESMYESRVKRKLVV